MSVALSIDQRFMTRAIALANRGWGTTHPNPIVGAVVVEDGKIVSEGWHEVAGGPHAEIAALRALGRKPKDGATVYVTLEPCSTVGKTGACTNALIQSSVRRVVVGTVDPNPQHAGNGLEVLRAAGMQVDVGVLSRECADLNLIFNHWIVEQTPMIALKMATTLDGKFSATSGQSKWITGPAARADVMRWRRYFPAIGISAATALADNPSLTSRIGETVWCPRRFVFDRRLRTASDGNFSDLYRDAFAPETTVVCLPGASPLAKKRLKAAEVSIWEIPAIGNSFDWSIIRRKLANDSLFGLYLEGGAGFATTILKESVSNYVFHYQAPKYLLDTMSASLGFERNTMEINEAFVLQNPQYQILDDNVLARGFIK